MYFVGLTPHTEKSKTQRLKDRGYDNETQPENKRMGQLS